MFKLWKMLKTAWHLLNHYHDDIAAIKEAIEESREYRASINNRLDQFETVILNAREEIIKRTTVNADVHVRDNSANIVVMGRYRGKDYVRIFSVRNSELDYLVNTLKGMEQSLLGRIRLVDAEPGFKAIVQR